jgi:hypothetical protein
MREKGREREMKIEGKYRQKQEQQASDEKERGLNKSSQTENSKKKSLFCC